LIENIEKQVDEVMEVGSVDSTQSVGKLRTRGSDRQSITLLGETLPVLRDRK